MTKEYSFLPQHVYSKSYSDGLHPSSLTSLYERLPSTQPEIDDNYITPISPLTYTQFSGDESLASRESLPTTPEGGYTQGTTPAEGFTPLDSPRVPSDLNNQVLMDFSFSVTPAEPFEFTAGQTEQLEGDAEGHDTLCPLTNPTLNPVSPVGSPFTPGRTLDCVHDALHCLMEEAEADGESLSEQIELEELMAPLDLGPAALAEDVGSQRDDTDTIVNITCRADDVDESFEQSIPGLPWEVAEGDGEYDELVWELEAAFEKEAKEQRRLKAGKAMQRQEEEEDVGYTADSED
jgi:hypothetical protein